MMVAPRIVIVVGEASGDILGADLIRAIHGIYPHATFEGIGGPLMQQQGFTSHFSMDHLSIMGIVEVIKHIRPLLQIRHSLLQRYLHNPPDLFIGIDAPDFNLPLARKFKQSGIKTVHYVSPSLWAWRSGRIKTIKKSVDHMLTLLPFETKIYQTNHIPVTFVGHPLADEIPLTTSAIDAQNQLHLPKGHQWIALLPGSRLTEIRQLAIIFLETARLLQHQHPDLYFIIPAANAACHAQLTIDIAAYNDLNLVLINGQSRHAMQAADAVLLASGTATLEAMLLKKPMVVSYKLNWLTYQIVSRMLKVPWVALPNLLANEPLIEEHLQNSAQPEILCDALMRCLQTDVQQRLSSQFMQWHQKLRKNAGTMAAQVIGKLLSTPTP